jgi:DNA-binding winged helix-turn-helix (wHTH) protein
MLNNIAIGTAVSLDLQARTLSRIRDGKSVTLPVSACNCLKALVEAKEEVLSQEQLMDIGWRNAGVEVTENSVRVMINKIRRAISSLDMQDSITLLAVTRSGYRLIIRNAAGQLGEFARQAKPEEIPKSSALPSEFDSSATEPPQIKTTRATWKYRIIATLAGLILGMLMAMFIGWLLRVSPDPVKFVRWSGKEAPPLTEVWVPAASQSEDLTIRRTLELYAEYALKSEAKTDKANHLYITVGKDPQYYGLVACVAPLQDSENNCESYYFRYH